MTMPTSMSTSTTSSTTQLLGSSVPNTATAAAPFVLLPSSHQHQQQQQLFSTTTTTAAVAATTAPTRTTTIARSVHGNATATAIASSSSSKRSSSLRYYRRRTNSSLSSLLMTTIIMMTSFCFFSSCMTSSSSSQYILGVVSAIEYCNICPNSPSNTAVPIDSTAHLPNPNLNVANFGSGGSTCAYVQQTVAYVPAVGGTTADSEWCKRNQFLACVAGCCHPPGSTNLGDGSCYGDKVYDPNPACNLCGGSVQRQFDYVPGPNFQKVTDTRYVGTHNCEGLYHAASEGIFSANFCPVIQSESGKDCCDL
jgi:hypothetical protein